jgi:adenosylcobinamide-GDP ribazoletransferase
MQGEWLWLLCAWQFLTRLPAPRREVWPADWLGRSAKYFPLVGGVVGGLQGLVLLAAKAHCRPCWPSAPAS